RIRLGSRTTPVTRSRPGWSGWRSVRILRAPGRRSLDAIAGGSQRVVHPGSIVDSSRTSMNVSLSWGWVGFLGLRARRGNRAGTHLPAKAPEQNEPRPGHSLRKNEPIQVRSPRKNEPSSAPADRSFHRLSGGRPFLADHL